MPAKVVADVTTRLTEIADLLAEHQTSESERWDGWRPDLPGRGSAMLPPYIVDQATDSIVRGRITFTRYYLGGNGAAHGGTQPLLFDDLLGLLVNQCHGQGVARTAFLKVNYRRIAPIGDELHFEATIDQIDGRKRWASGRLVTPGGTLVAAAEGLFVKLLPGSRDVVAAVIKACQSGSSVA